MTEKHLDDKSEPTPSAVSVENSLKSEEKESAPIFALFHGKIVPLGKLPDTSFKKSHTEAKIEENESKDEIKKEKDEKATNHENYEAKSELKESDKHASKSEAQEDQETAEKREKSKALSPSQFTRLSSYFHNLDTKSKAAVETRMLKSHKKDVTGTAKDEVPGLLPEMKNSEFLKHVQGIVLDDGKMVTLKGKKEKAEEQQVT